MKKLNRVRFSLILMLVSCAGRSPSVQEAEFRLPVKQYTSGDLLWVYSDAAVPRDVTVKLQASENTDVNNVTISAGGFINFIDDSMAAPVKISGLRSVRSAACLQVPENSDSGEYRILISHDILLLARYTVQVVRSQHKRETIEMNAKMNGIAADRSELKREQSRILSEILMTVNSEPPLFDGFFQIPLDESTVKRVTSGYHDERSFVSGGKVQRTAIHKGVDWGLPEGTPILAAGAGRVVFAEERIVTGYSVILEHFPGLYTLYYHLSRLDVEMGDIVQRGEQIGAAGASGYATGSHLHFEIRYLSNHCRPRFLINN